MITATIVIPTHDRATSVVRTLQSLSRQSYSAERMEVVVVADGCQDDTLERIRSLEMPYRLVLVEQAAAGPSAARNRGVRAGSGNLLIFLDDDIEVASGFVAAHVGAHKGAHRRVVIGYLPAQATSQSLLFRASLIEWWESMFDRMREPGYLFRYSDLLSGNVSVPRSLFEAAGGFDETLRCHEDYELGLRLLDAGAAFHFCQEAWGFHHEKTDLQRALRRKFDEGQADVQIGRLHPSMRRHLPLSERVAGLSWRLQRRLAFSRPVWGALFVSAIWQALRAAETLRLRGSWTKLVHRLMAIHYWRGVAHAVGTRTEFERFVQDAARDEDLPVSIEIDLADGLSNAEQRLDAERPAAIIVKWKHVLVGQLRSKAGEERFHGGHLRPHLASTLGLQLIQAVGFCELAANLDAPSDEGAATRQSERDNRAAV